MTKLSKAAAHSYPYSPYNVFCREQRPLLPAHLKCPERERLLGQNWRELSEAGRAAYTRGLTRLPCSGQGGLREWAPTPPTKLPTPPSGAVSATFLAGCGRSRRLSRSLSLSREGSEDSAALSQSRGPACCRAEGEPGWPGGGVNVEPNTTTRRRCSGFARRAPAAPAGRNEQYRPREGLQG